MTDRISLRGRVVGACALILAGTLACGQGQQPPPSPPAATSPAPSPSAAPAAPSASSAKAAHEEAENVFATRCVTCHGESGRGDGPASAGLSPKPRDFTDAAWQKSVTDEHIETIVQYGGAAVGRSAAMPANPDLTSKPEVVAALREHVRSLGSK